MFCPGGLPWILTPTLPLSKLNEKLCRVTPITLYVSYHSSYDVPVIASLVGNLASPSLEASWRQRLSVLLVFTAPSQVPDIKEGWLVKRMKELINWLIKCFIYPLLYLFYKPFQGVTIQRKATKKKKCCAMFWKQIITCRLSLPFTYIHKEEIRVIKFLRWHLRSMRALKTKQNREKQEQIG